MNPVRRSGARPAGFGDLIGGSVETNTERIDEAVLALLYLGLHDGSRAWKAFDWDAMARLHERGLITNPITKGKSVAFTEAGLREARRVFEALFTR